LLLLLSLLGTQPLGIGEIDLWDSGKVPSPWKSDAYKKLEKGKQLDFGQRLLHMADAAKVLPGLKEPSGGLMEKRKIERARQVVGEVLSAGQQQRKATHDLKKMVC
jgi:hypothetical protein